LVPFWRSPAPLAAEKRQFVDLQNDVTVADLRQALAEGFHDIEHVKRYTTLGIGTEQGRTSAVLGAAIIAELSGSVLPAVGLSRSRPPYQPVTLQALAGLRIGGALRPERRTAMHEWHRTNGGELEAVGLWIRPRYYRVNGADPFTAGIAEAARVRSHGGILDGSTLGKIEVAGPDAAAFLDRVYLIKASTIKVGRSRYMVMLREDGMVLDDGILLRLATDRFLATTGTGHAGRVLSHLEFWRDTEAAGQAVSLTDVTDAWAVIVVAGPRSRAALCEVLTHDWRERIERLSHLHFACGTWQGGELRVLRASFSGELAYELHCRPVIALPLWQALAAAGLLPYGLEALDILRVEKGYLVSAEINGQTSPQDLGMMDMLKSGNACIGRQLLDRPALHDAERPRLTGLRAADGRSRFLPGAQIVACGMPDRSVGHVTSSVYSPTLGEWVGLALLARGLAREGAELLARDPLHDGETRVRVVPPAHFDPSGARMKS
ncbi:MAG: glycine cleavage T C-terminal barrel domain-containing protein, partial [Steroidobacteraceae bacterium]